MALALSDQIDAVASFWKLVLPLYIKVFVRVPQPASVLGTVPAYLMIRALIMILE